MGTLVNFVLRFTDLLEAEGRVAREALGELAVGVAVLALACSLAALACVAGAVAISIGLSLVMPPGAALAIVCVLLSLGAVAFWATGRKLLRSTSRRVER